ncbi:MAG TPA: Ig-like domain repeat protein [Edaphobacter sp.]|uniref:Ig-like domain repeat protein n=1 Tax=Edaphobacter sp. TaxID=1934404 RepID=UPI002CBB1FE3|nr:Ig-like domain repeat protein [Edaphobacter sp.]HUZ93959.1 Ig-like domain repeat protein [Edaphobacter sp.]
MNQTADKQHSPRRNHTGHQLTGSSFNQPSGKSRYSHMVQLGLIVCLFLIGSLSQAVAQAAYVFSPAMAVGGTPQVQPIPVVIQTAGTLGTVKVLTQGTANLDFTLSSVGACATGAGQTCNVSVSFSPRYPGLRFGAIVILDAGDGHIMASQNIVGTGQGSLSVFSPGQITTLAGDGCLSDGPCPTNSGTPATTGAALNLPLGEATDAAGNLYISDTGNNRIEMVTPGPAGTVSTIAGNTGIAGSAGDGGPALSAEISAPSAIFVDGAGNIFFADTGNSAIREINAITQKISTVAGTLGTSGSTGNALAGPQGFAFDASGNLYIADTGNNRIQKVDTAGVATTVPGTFNQPWSIAISSKDGSLYIADFGSNRILKIDPLGVETTVAGTGTASYGGDGQTATSATLNSPSSVAVDPADNLYIADSENNAIRKVISSTGKIATLAGDGTAVFGGDGFNANLAGLYKPYSVYLDASGNLFIADRLDLRIREVSATAAGIHFPNMKEGKTSLPIAQTVENDGNAPLNLTDLTAAPGTTNATIDPITTTCSTTVPLPIDGTCILAVEFQPPPTIADGAPLNTGILGTGALSVASDSGSSPIAVDLSGTVLSVNPSSTTVTSSSNPAAVNQGITFTANISSPNHVTGTVQFFDGATPIEGPQPVISASNTATINWSFTSLGTHFITAVYGGDNLNAASTPNNSLSQVIEQSTTLIVVPTPNPATEFAAINFTATLGGWTTAPTGNVTFADGARSLGSAVIGANGIANFPVTSLAVGQHTINAVFAGDANDFGSQYSFVQTINFAPSSTTVIPSTYVAQFSTPITFTATVTGVPASTPTGNVAFKDGSSVLSTVPVNSLGVAIYVNTTLPAGTHNITAVYLGDSDYAGSTSISNVTITINQTATTTHLSASTLNSIATRPVTLTATVTALGAIPTGTVSFMNGNVLIGTAILNHGVASAVTSSLPVGTDSVSAIYNGDSNDTGSTSAPPLAVTIVKAPTTTVVSSSQSPLPTLTPVVISATVANGGTQKPTGLVTFVEDSVSIGVGTLDANGVATISIPYLAAGSHTFVANYAGDGLDLASAAAPFLEVVQLRPTTDALTSSTTSLSGGQQLTLISVIRPTGTIGSVAPTGTVTFMSGSITLATVPVDASGVATVTVLLPGTSASLSSTYSGDSNYATSTASPSTVPIGPAPDFTLEATPITLQLQSKQHLDVKVSLSSVRNFTDTFSFGCLGLPEDTTCTFSKDKANLPAGGVQSVTLTVDTGHPLLSGSQASNEQRSNSKIAMACLFPGAFAFGFLAFKLRRVRLVSGLLLFVGIIAMTSGLSGCGTIQNSGTPPGTYNFLVSATGQTGVSQYVDITMTVTK